jgi:hypothetical protein
MAQRTGAVTGASEAAKEPFRKTTREFEIAQQEKALKSREYLGELAATVELMGAGLRQQGATKVGEREIYALAEGAVKGDADLPNSAAGLHARAALQASGFTPFEKKKSTELSNIRQTEPLVYLVEKFYDKHLKGKQTGGAITNWAKQNIPLLPTDIKADYGLILSQAGQIAKSIGGESGRLTEKDIERAMGILSKPNLTDEQAKDIIVELKNTINGRIMKTVLGKYSPGQQKMILEHHGFDLNSFNLVVDGKARPVFRESEGKTFYLNPENKRYEPVNEPKMVPPPDVEGTDIFDLLKGLGLTKENKKGVLEMLPEVKKSSKIEGFNLDDYATDANWEKGINTIRTAINKNVSLDNEDDIDKYIQERAPGAALTAKMVLDVSKKQQVPADLILAIMQHESMFGTKGRGAKTFNPGNVGNFDDGRDTNMGNWEKGIEAIGKFLSKRRASNV